MSLVVGKVILPAVTIRDDSVAMALTVRVIFASREVTVPIRKTSTPANSPSFLAFAGLTRPCTVSLFSARMRLVLARSSIEMVLAGGISMLDREHHLDGQ